MPLLRKYTLSASQLAKLCRRIRCPDNYVPGEDPILDKVYLHRTNRAWIVLGDKLGFNWETVRPHPDGDPANFLAEPKEPS